MRIGLFAVDNGTRLIMRTLAKYDGFVIISVGENNFDDLDAVIVGTSGSNIGQDKEANIRCLASHAGVPLVIIEDYPGNYCQVTGGQPNLLIVEHLTSRDIYLKRLGEQCPDITVIPNPRYDYLRESARDIHMVLVNRWEESRDTYSALWAGQPETDDALNVLARIIPILRDVGVRFLFKAHPRDLGHTGGAYMDIAVSLGELWIDVSNLNLLQCLEMYAPRILITQFSSMAIETGFYGIPSMNVLFPDIGEKRLQADKGFSLPPWCADGAAVSVRNTDEMREKLPLLLYDKCFRDRVNTKFNIWFGTEPSADKVVNILDQLIRDYGSGPV